MSASTLKPKPEPITWTRARQVYDSMLARTEARLREHLQLVVDARARGYVPLELREEE